MKINSKWSSNKKAAARTIFAFTNKCVWILEDIDKCDLWSCVWDKWQMLESACLTNMEFCIKEQTTSFTINIEQVSAAAFSTEWFSSANFLFRSLQEQLFSI